MWGHPMAHTQPHANHSGRHAGSYEHHQPPAREPHLSHRFWTKAPDTSGSGATAFDPFRVMSYNILAQELAQDHAGDLYPQAPAWCLQWEHRISLILHDIAGWSPDVVCLQEVDRYQDLAAVMAQRGYEGAYVQRTGGRADGCATFWLKAKFRAVLVDPLHMSHLGLKDNVALLVLLQPLQPPQQQHQQQGAGGVGLLVANTHILFNTKRGDIKLGQLRSILDRLWHVIHSAEHGLQHVACMLAGDLNTAPGSGLYQFMQEGRLTLNTLDRRRLSGQIEGFGYSQYLRQLRQGYPPLQGYKRPAPQQQQQQQQQQQEEQARRACAATAAAAAPLLTSTPPSEVRPQHIRFGDSSPTDPAGPSDAAGQGGSSMEPEMTPTCQTAVQQGGGSSADAGAGARLKQWAGPYAATTYEAWSSTVQVAVQLDSSAAQQDLEAGASTPTAAVVVQRTEQSAYFSAPAALGSATGPGASSSSSTVVTEFMSSNSRAKMFRTPEGHRKPQSALQRLGWADEELTFAMGRAWAGRAQQLGEGGGELQCAHPLRLSSAYHDACGHEPTFTTCHARCIGTVDYIWYTPAAVSATGSGVQEGQAGPSAQAPSLHVVAALQPPDATRFAAGMPNPSWPSDHIALVCDFVVKMP